MPSLKDLNCSLELSADQKTLSEYGTTYADGVVETFVAVPGQKRPFSIHLTSKKFIAPGIAMYVFIDGIYQCNRNRQNLKLRKDSDSRSIVDFKVRQKEEKQQDGSMLAREWTFEELQTVASRRTTEESFSNLLDNLGCIEVVVLRCAGPRNARTTAASHLNVDGANDAPEDHSDLKRHPWQSSSRSLYDDRGHLVKGYPYGSGPPPPVPGYRAPYAETYRSTDGSAMRKISQSEIPRPRRQSRYSEPLSPRGHQPSSIPPSSFHYGSGPLPGHTQGVDPIWLDAVLTKAVKQGVEESRRHNETLEVKKSPAVINDETVSQPPGAWPNSPIGADARLSQNAALDTSKHEEYAGWSSAEHRKWHDQSAREKSAAHVTWDTEPVWETSSSSNNWDTADETPRDSWDTEEPWQVKENKTERSASTRAPSRTPHQSAHRISRDSSPATIRIRHRRQLTNHQTSHPSTRSRSRRHSQREQPATSSEDNNGWTRIDAPPDSTTSWETSTDTVKPFHSISEVSTPHGRFKKHAYSDWSSHQHRRPKSTKSKHRDHVWEQAPSVATRVTPVVVNAPASEYAAIQPPSIHGPAYSAPPLQTRGSSWGSAVPDQMRQFGTANSLPPAPYAATIHEFARSNFDRGQGETGPVSSLHWGSYEDSGRKDGWGSATMKKSEGKGDTSADTGIWETRKDDFAWEVIEPENTNNGWTTAEEKKQVHTNAWSQHEDDWDKQGTSNNGNPSIAVDGWDTTKPPSGIKNKASPDKLSRRRSTAVQWNDTADNASVDTSPLEPKPPSKRHTRKSLSKYRQLRTPTLPSTSHRQFPPPPSNHTRSPHATHPVPEEPFPAISAAAASEKGIAHQVRAGRGTAYGHAVSRPTYIDSLEKPYAVFRFKYRAAEKLQEMFGRELLRGKGGKEAAVAVAVAVAVEKEKEKLKLEQMPQAELVERMMQLQMEVAGKHGGGEEQRERKRKDGRASETRAEDVARGLTEKWVVQQSQEASRMGSAGKEKVEAEEIWGKKVGRKSSGGARGGWNDVKW
ncbi:hypothetical protein ACN47E_003061 [Coniothyrium glycines]